LLENVHEVRFPESLKLHLNDTERSDRDARNAFGFLLAANKTWQPLLQPAQHGSFRKELHGRANRTDRGPRDQALESDFTTG